MTLEGCANHAFFAMHPYFHIFFTSIFPKQKFINCSILYFTTMYFFLFPLQICEEKQEEEEEEEAMQ